MFRILTILVALSVCIPAWRPGPAAAQEWPKTVTVLGQELTLKFRDEKSGFLLLEYIPAAETLEQWTTMFAVHRYDSRVANRPFDARSTVRSLINRTLARQPGDPVAGGGAFTRKSDPQSYYADFALSEGGTVEHNVFRYFDTANGMVGYQYARRTGIAQAQQYFESLVSRREHIYDALFRIDLPAPDPVAR